MEFPAIIALEGSTHEDSAFPIALAWTLPDAMYKAVFARPIDEWLHAIGGEETAIERPLEELNNTGESIVDIAKEMQKDLETDVLYCEDFEFAEKLLEKLFDGAGMELPWEVKSIRELFKEHSEGEVESLTHYVMDRLDLSPHEAEANVLLWRAVYAQLNSDEEDQLAL